MLGATFGKSLDSLLADFIILIGHDPWDNKAGIGGGGGGGGGPHVLDLITI